MNREYITRTLSETLLRTKLIDKMWAAEVTLDYASNHPVRVDYMTFEPVNTLTSGIEKGIFTCYEVKSCKEDLYSGNGLNFVGEKGYIVTTMENYKNNLLYDARNKFFKYYEDTHKGETLFGVGYIVAIPKGRSKYDEFDNPTPFEAVQPQDWDMDIIMNARLRNRIKPMTDLLFCMLRSKCHGN